MDGMVDLSQEFNQLHGTHATKQYTVIAEPAHPPGWRMKPHSHVQHEITFVRDGACYFSLQDGLHKVEAGEVCFLPPHVLHGHEPYEDQCVELVVVQFPHLTSELHAQLINTAPIGYYQLSELESSQFLNVCYQLQREIAGKLPYSDSLCHSYIKQLAVILLRSEAQQGIQSLSSEQQAAIEEAVEWIHQNWQHNFQIADLAERVGFSSSHFRALFRQAVGVSPKQYTIALRLQSSKCMLMHAESTVTEVARLAGFNSPQEFSKVFRRLTGMPPSKWKQIHLD